MKKVWVTYDLPLLGLLHTVCIFYMIVCSKFPGWLFKVELSKPEEVDELMDEDKYQQFLKTNEWSVLHLTSFLNLSYDLNSVPYNYILVVSMVICKIYDSPVTL